MTGPENQRPVRIRLLDFPDLENSLDLLNAGAEDIHRMIDLMMDKGKYQTPEPYQNLQYGIKTMQEAYLKYRAEGAPDSRLELLRRWMEDAQGLLAKAVEGTNPPPPMPQTVVPQTNMPIEDQAAAAQEQAALAAQEAPLVETPGSDIPGDQEPLAPGV